MKTISRRRAWMGVLVAGLVAALGALCWPPDGIDVLLPSPMMRIFAVLFFPCLAAVVCSLSTMRRSWLAWLGVSMFAVTAIALLSIVAFAWIHWLERDRTLVEIIEESEVREVVGNPPFAGYRIYSHGSEQSVWRSTFFEYIPVYRMLNGMVFLAVLGIWAGGIVRLMAIWIGKGMAEKGGKEVATDVSKGGSEG